MDVLASLTTMLWNAPSKSWTGGTAARLGVRDWKRYFKAKRHLPALRAALTAHRAKAKTNAPIPSSRARITSHPVASPTMINIGRDIAAPGSCRP